MSFWVWSAFTEISVEAGKNNEYPEPQACGLGPFGSLYRSPTSCGQSTLGRDDVNR